MPALRVAIMLLLLLAKFLAELIVAAVPLGTLRDTRRVELRCGPLGDVRGGDSGCGSAGGGTRSLAAGYLFSVSLFDK